MIHVESGLAWIIGWHTDRRFDRQSADGWWTDPRSGERTYEQMVFRNGVIIMRHRNNQLDRRDFMKNSAHATAAAAIAAAGMSANAACGAVPEDKNIAFTNKLPTRVLGKMNVELPVLGYGGAALPKKFGNNLSTEDRVKLVRHAYDSGIRYFDTAISISYGDSQTIIGKALKDVRDNVFITTKVDFWDKSKPDGSVTEIKKGEVAQQVERNLAELQSDYIDANIKTLAGDTTCTNEDRALLAGVSAAVLSDENVRRMPGE